MSRMINPPIVEETVIENLFELGESQSLLTQLISITSQDDAEYYLEGMLDLIVQTAHAGSATYFSFDSETSESVISAVRGDIAKHHLLGLRYKSGSEFSNPKLSGAQLITAGELYDDPLWLQAVNPRDAARMRNLIILPVRTSQRDLGIIHLFNFENADLTTLQLLADHLAHGLNQRERFLQTQVHNQRLSELLEAISQMTGILDRNQLLQSVTEKASQLFEGERSTVFIVDPATHETIYNVSFQAPKQADLQISDLNHHQAEKPVHSTSSFNFLTRSAISAQLTSWVKTKNGRQDGAILGGLMVLNKRAGAFQEQDASVLNILAEQASALLQVAELYESSEKLFMDTIRALVAVIDAKDPGTQGHSTRVSDYSVLIAQEMDLDEPQINDIRISSMLHDLGKIGIPEAILNKQGSLTPEEREIINRHPIIGANILGQIDALSNIVPGILEHHERIDGSGYPFGLRGEQISLFGRIITVADVFDAMTSPRPYRAALSVTETINYLRTNSGKLFDPSCIQALLTILERSTDVTRD